MLASSTVPRAFTHGLTGLVAPTMRYRAKVASKEIPSCPLRHQNFQVEPGRRDNLMASKRWGDDLNRFCQSHFFAADAWYVVAASGSTKENYHPSSPAQNNDCELASHTSYDHFSMSLKRALRGAKGFRKEAASSCFKTCLGCWRSLHRHGGNIKVSTGGCLHKTSVLRHLHSSSSAVS